MSNPTPAPATEKRPPAAAFADGSNHKEIILRVLFVVLVLGSLAFVWWSVKRLRPRQKEVAELNATVNRISAEVDLMERHWTRDEAKRILERYGQVDAQLFVGQPSLDSWYLNLRQQVIPMALDVKPDFGRSAVETVVSNKVSIIPTTVSIDVRPAAGIDAIRSPYERILRLSRMLTQQDRRADLVELKVAGGSNSVSRATAVLNLWAGAGEEVQQ